ncbi:MAG TPA: hypothetical protein VF338_08445, partial [Leptolinea sp.]
ARCFHWTVRDRASRYSQICRTLEDTQIPFFVPTRYLQQGVNVNGKSFPISVLKWVDGESLETYIFHHLEEPAVLLDLAEKFRNICIKLESYGIAHGDFSHRNILIKTAELFLIDYDGMFVPSLAGRRSCELGNIHFQHPLRTNQFFNSQLDRFSSIVIYLAILALSAEPLLWRQFQSGGEGLLFQRSDYQNPVQSPLLLFLNKLSITARYIAHFREICLSQVENTPSLEMFISGYSAASKFSGEILNVNRKVNSHTTPVLDAWSMDSIKHSEGEIITIIGRIGEVFHGHTLPGENHIFINFGNWKEKCFTAVLWGQVLADVNLMDIPVDSWVGQWMSVTGLVAMINNRPQIQIESLTDFILLSSEENARVHLESAFKEGRYKTRVETKKIINLKSPQSSLKVVKESKKPDLVIFDIKQIFNSPNNSSIEAMINQLYSSDHFKADKK